MFFLVMHAISSHHFRLRLDVAAVLPGEPATVCLRARCRDGPGRRDRAARGRGE